MKITRHPRLTDAALCAFVLLAAAALGNGAAAEQVVVTSKKPYWTVGERDEKMSRACSLQRFNLKRTDKLVAHFIGAEGAETLAVAKGSGTNLWDPEHLGKPSEDYYFRNHSTTSCEVYVGGRRGKPAGSRPPGLRVTPAARSCAACR
jgi:hypothetical protein